jgi:hypothetical protein
VAKTAEDPWDGRRHSHLPSPCLSLASYLSGLSAAAFLGLPVPVLPRQPLPLVPRQLPRPHPPSLPPSLSPSLQATKTASTGSWNVPVGLWRGGRPTALSAWTTGVRRRRRRAGGRAGSRGGAASAGLTPARSSSAMPTSS